MQGVAVLIVALDLAVLPATHTCVWPPRRPTAVARSAQGALTRTSPASSRQTMAHAPGGADVSDVLERKIRGIALYESQLERLFPGESSMAEAVRGYAARVADLGRVPNGAAERYWVTTPA